MSDFDFDELDKAVAGVLGPEDSASAEPVVSPAPAAPVAPTTPAAPQDEPKSEPTVVQRTSLAPAARRSSGRFMDVVHPSSDMRTRTGYAPASEPVASEPRTTTFVAPTAPEGKEAEDWSKPLESPFLPDAKVEKRPLGGLPGAPEFNPEELIEAPEEELKLEEPDEPRLEATTLPDPIDFANQSSEEPTHVEIPVESEVDSTPVAPAAEVPEVSVADVPSDLEQEGPISEPVEPVQPAQPEEVTGPTSITQQYQEQPSDAKPSGAIYDTETYHQPMAVAPKKRGSAWGIIWIILLVILGAGAGVAFYLFVLPML